MLRQILLINIFLLTSWFARAQSFSALQNSNFNGVHGIYTNPASVTLMTHKRSANIGTFGFEVTNNYLKLNAPFSMWNLVSGGVGNEYRKADGSIDWQESWIQTDPSVSEIAVNMSSELRGPAYVNNYGRFTWGTATRTRTHANIQNMNPQMWQFVRQWIDSQQLINPLNLAAQSFQMSANSYQEISAVLGLRAVNTSTFKLGVATTLKGILGLGSVNVSNSGASFSAIAMDTLAMTSGRMELAYTDNNLLNQIFKGVFTGSLPNLNSINGFGYGLDIGVAMEFGSDMETEYNNRQAFKDYQFKIGAAILDLGQVSYRNQNEGYIIDATQQPFKLALNNAAFIESLEQGTQGVLNYALDEAEKQGTLKTNNEKTEVVLPSTLQIQFDWRFIPGVYVAGHWQQALHIGDKWEFNQQSIIAVVPRFEHKWFEFSVPVRYQQQFNRMSIGAHTRIGPVFLGTDNMANIFKVSPYSGMTFYMGISTLIR